MKKFLALFLSLTMCLSMSTMFVSAAEDTSSTIPEYATRNTIELTLEPGENAIDVVTGDSDNGVAPCIWGDPSMSLADHYSSYTSSFYVSDKYFAYEMEALPASGVPTTQTYNVGLEYVGGAVLVNLSGAADGGVYKKDWITINTDGNYRFLVSNLTDYAITVFITYYSWN